MSLLVQPVNIPYGQKIKYIKNILGLNEPPFDNIDNDLILLAMIPTSGEGSRLISKNKIRILRNKFGTDNHQTLEFYGDKIFYAVIGDILLENIGLDSTPKILSDISFRLASNRFFTDIMLDKGLCHYLISQNYTINDKSGPFHNKCADTLEAFLGAMFYHLKKQNLDVIKYIKSWFVKNTKLYSFILSEIAGKKYKLYVDSQDTRESDLYREKLLSYAEDLREDLGEELYNETIADLNKDIFDENERPRKSLVVTPYENIVDIYSKLNWKYNYPVYNPEIGFFEMIGYPGYYNTPIVIGYGNTQMQAEIDARDYLIRTGTISEVSPFYTTFSKK